MTHYEEIEIRGLETTLSVPIVIPKQKLANLMAQGGNPQAVLMMCYHTCTDIRGAMKLIRACRYLHDPDLFEMCKRIQESTKRKRKRGYFSVELSEPKETHELTPGLTEGSYCGFLGLTWDQPQ